MKKKRIKPTVTATIDPDLVEKVQEETNRDNTSVSAVLRKALRQYYETDAEPSYGSK
jgi:uncharacterized protein (DUF4415 family)